MFIYRVSIAQKPLGLHVVPERNTSLYVVPGRPSTCICTIFTNLQVYYVYLFHKNTHDVFVNVYISSLYCKKSPYTFMSSLGDLQHAYVPSSRRCMCTMCTFFRKVHIMGTCMFIYRVSIAKKPLRRKKALQAQTSPQGALCVLVCLYIGSLLQKSH